MILIGDSHVGKTFLLTRYTRGVVPRGASPTIGVELATHTVPLPVGGTVKAQIWDTAGQEKYRQITCVHFKSALGVLLVYDTTKRETFVNVAQWLKALRETGNPNAVIILVGNKVDLCERNPHQRQIPFKQAADFAAKNGLFFSEASAETGHNVKRIFEVLLQEIYNQQCRAHSSTNKYGSAHSHVIVDTPSTLSASPPQISASQASNKYNLSLNILSNKSAAASPIPSPAGVEIGSEAGRSADDEKRPHHATSQRKGGSRRERHEGRSSACVALGADTGRRERYYELDDEEANRRRTDTLWRKGGLHTQSPRSNRRRVGCLGLW